MMEQVEKSVSKLETLTVHIVKVYIKSTFVYTNDDTEHSVQSIPNCDCED